MEEALELHPMVQSSMVFGDGRPFCVALVVVDPAAAKTWAEHHGLPAETDYRALVLREDLQQGVSKELIESLKGRFGSYEVPKKFLFIDEPFTVANGLLTQTMKLKRRQIVARYQAQIAKAY